MQLAQVPELVQLPFADSGTKNSIPTPSQVSITPGAASLTTGFPPITFLDPTAGGIPPFGADFNGILNLISANTRWENAGAFYPYDATFSTYIGGYPKGAILSRADGTGFWLSTADDNLLDPETDTSGAWVPVNNNGITAITGLTNANVTLTALEYSKRIITLAGTLTGNVQIIFPAIAGLEWTVINNTTGAFTVTCKTSAGTGIISYPGVFQGIYSDGTNIQLAGSPPAGTPTGSSLNLSMSVTTASATATITADEVIVSSAIGGANFRLSNLSKTINLATTGAGGMDTGTAPVSGSVAIYLIYDPITGVSALLGVDSTTTVPPEVYGGSNMPSGYSASALVSVWMTDGSSQFITGEQRDRRIARGRITAVSTTTANATFTSASIASNVPKAAKTVRGDIQNTNSSTTNTCTCAIASNNLGIDAIYFTSLFNAQGGFDVILSSAQVIYYLDTTTSGTNNLTIYVSGYTF